MTHEHEEQPAIIYDRRKEDSSMTERHIQTFLGAIILMVMGWVGFQVTEQQKVIASMQVRIESMKEDIGDIKNDLKVATNDRFTATEAQKRQEACNDRMQRLEERIRELEFEKNGYKNNH
jgi:acetylornithine/succinyldiaminopimelate/putrescine aminotransferase